MKIDSTYADNAMQISQLTSFLREMQADPTITIKSISFGGAASPEGSYQYNKKLAHGRLKALEKVVRNKVEIPDSLIAYDDNYIPWDYLASMVKDSRIPRKQEILEVLDDEPKLVEYYDDRTIDNRYFRLKRLGRKLWKRINREFFAPMRNACMVCITFQKEQPVIQEEQSLLLKSQPDTLVIASVVNSNELTITKLPPP